MPVADFEKIAPEIESFHLQDDDRPNAGHISMVRNGTGWFVSFDLRYNAVRIAEVVLAAQEFLDSDAANLSAQRLRAFVNELFCAVELLAKARLLVHPDERVLASKKHSFTISNFNLHAKWGNVDRRFSDLLNRLSSLRNPARYPDGSFALSREAAEELLATARDMHRELLPVLPSRALRTLKPESEPGTGEESPVT